MQIPNEQQPQQPTNGGGIRQGVTIRGRHFTLPWVIGGVVLALVVLTCGCCGTLGAAGALRGGGNSTSTAGDTVTFPTTPPEDTATVGGTQVLHVAGASQAVTSKPFTVHGTWAITWGCTPTNYGADMLVMVNDPSNTVASSDIPTIRYTCTSNGAGTQTYHASGTFTLSVSGGAAWDIVVLDVKG